MSTPKVGFHPPEKAVVCNFQRRLSYEHIRRERVKLCEYYQPGPDFFVVRLALPLPPGFQHKLKLNVGEVS